MTHTDQIGPYYNQAGANIARRLLKAVAEKHNLSTELAAVVIVQTANSIWLRDASRLIAAANGQITLMLNSENAMMLMLMELEKEKGENHGTE